MQSYNQIRYAIISIRYDPGHSIPSDILLWSPLTHNTMSNDTEHYFIEIINDAAVPIPMSLDEIAKYYRNC